MSDDLLIKYLLRETSPEEDIELSHWLAEDPENRKEFERFELIWKESKNLEQKSTVDPDAGAVMPAFGVADVADHLVQLGDGFGLGRLIHPVELRYPFAEHVA